MSKHELDAVFKSTARGVLGVLATNIGQFGPSVEILHYDNAVSLLAHALQCQHEMTIALIQNEKKDCLGGVWRDGRE